MGFQKKCSSKRLPGGKESHETLSRNYQVCIHNVHHIYDVLYAFLDHGKLKGIDVVKS